MAIYDAIGGMETCRRLAVAFYVRVARDAVLRTVYSKSLRSPLDSPKSSHCAADALALFLAQYFGGPCEYSRQRFSLSLYDAHLRFKIGPAARDAWLANMLAAMEDVGIAAGVREEMSQFFAEASRYLINRPPGDVAPDSLPFDQAVAAVREGNLARVVELAEHPEFRRDRAAWLSLLGVMAGSEDARMVEYAIARVAADPGIVNDRLVYDGTLLHAAARAGCPAMVEVLLGLGAGNGCTRDTASAVVRALVAGGADVNAQDRVKRCTALHAAARRGNVEVARALLDAGADVGVMDRQGATALDRAVNCRKAEVAKLLRVSG